MHYMLILEIKLLPCGSAAHFVTAFVELLGGAYVVVQFYLWFKFYFPLFQTHYHTLP